jgi:hypothetical protein
MIVQSSAILGGCGTGILLLALLRISRMMGFSGDRITGFNGSGKTLFALQLRINLKKYI